MMNNDDIAMRRLNRLVHTTIKEIKSVLDDCSLSEMDKIDEIEAIVKSYIKKIKLIHPKPP